MTSADSKSLPSYFRWAIVATGAGLALGAYLGWQNTGTPARAAGTLLVCAVLAVLEISLSFDNAIVNANKLREMTPLWQKRFPTWGIRRGDRRLRPDPEPLRHSHRSWIGAMYVRSMTIMLVDRQTLAAYRYLEHGAFWAILILAVIMYAQALMYVPEMVTGLAGAGLIGVSLWSSIRHKNAQAGAGS